MLDHSDIVDMYYTAVIIVALVLLLVNKYINEIKSRNKKFVFNSKTIESFDAWLSNTISMYMTKYIEDIMGSQLQQEEELNISTQFVQNGIDYVASTVLTQMPTFYRNYMTSFYGEDKLVSSIREKIRFIFIKFTESIIKKRLSGNVGALTSALNAQNQE